MATENEKDARIAALEAENEALKGASQLSREDLKGMKPQDVLQAQKDGRLKDILTRTSPRNRMDGRGTY